MHAELSMLEGCGDSSGRGRREGKGRGARKGRDEVEYADVNLVRMCLDCNIE